MIRIEPYKDINYTMHAIREQIVDSLDYCAQNFICRNPESLFKLLKANIRYKNDPQGIELLQTAQTLFDNNFHGIRGAGDCDCFTILAVACFVVNGWNDCYIVLAGRTKVAPSHIYCGVKYNGKDYTFDLTQSFINSKRFYKFTQKINL